MNPDAHLSALLNSFPGASRATSPREEFSFTGEGGKTSPAAFIGDGEAEPFKDPADDDGEGRPRLGRKPVATAARLAAVCARLAEGDTERAACLAAGIGLTSWNTAKRGSRELRERIEAARQKWARLRHAQHLAARLESQWTRGAGQKATPPRPTKNARLVVWHLTHRVALAFSAVPAAEIMAACARFNLTGDSWARQERAFGLMRVVHARRAKIRGEQPACPQRSSPYFTPTPTFQDGDSLSGGSVEDEVARWRP